MSIKPLKQPKLYNLVRKKPVARFYYQGSHSHPVRRTVLVVEETPTMIRGYEVREGNEVRTNEEALKKLKTYRKDDIPCWGDYKRLRMSNRTFTKRNQDSTLERCSIMSIFQDGA